jgi:hypothetical protein
MSQDWKTRTARAEHTRKVLEVIRWTLIAATKIAILVTYAWADGWTLAR